MRVAIVTESFLPRINGVTNSVCRVLEYLARRGHEALVVAPAPGPDSYAGFPVRLMPSVALPMYPSFALGLPTPKVEETLRDFAPDVVHLASPVVLGASGVSAARRLGIPSVAIFQTDLAGFARRHGFRGTDTAIWSWLRRLHGQADRTLAPSTDTLGQLVARGVPRTARWARGVDLDRFHPRHRSGALRAELAPEGEVLVGYVGRLSPDKRVHLLASLAGLPGIRLVVVGEGPAEPRLRRKLPGAAFLGFRTGEALSEALASLDVFVHTGANETFCQAIQEALAAGVPVVAPAAGGPLDLVTDGDNGWLFPPGRPRLLRSAAESLAPTPTCARRWVGPPGRASSNGRGRCCASSSSTTTAPLRQATSATASSGPREDPMVTPRLIVSVHDVAPSTAWATRYWSAELERLGVPVTFLVVPGPWEGPSFRFDTELVQWLHGRVEHGDEVAQHGWTHRQGPGDARWRRVVNTIAGTWVRGILGDRQGGGPAPRRARP